MAAAAAAELATVFLETSLGTRLVVSFPAAATTVADLKRQVTAEHAACFPQTGPIAVESLQVKHDGALFHLTDSTVVEGAFRWVQGPWSLLVEAREFRSHHRRLARDREDAGDSGSGGGSEQSSDSPVVSDSAQDLPPPAVSQGVGESLAIGDVVSGIPMLKQLGEPHQGLIRDSEHLGDDENALPQPQQCPDTDVAAGGSDTPSLYQQEQSHGDAAAKHVMGQQKDGIEQTMDQIRDENTVPQQSLDIDFAAGGSDIPSKDKQDQVHAAVAAKHAMGQQKDGIAQTMLQECSDPYLDAGGSGIAVDLHQSTSCEGVKDASGQPEDGNAKTESFDVDLAAGESESRVKNQLDKSHEEIEHGLSQCKDGNVKTILLESSSLDAMTGESETQSMNQPDKSSGQRKNGTVKAMFQEKKSDVNVAVAEGETLSTNQLDRSYESVKHASGQCEDGNVKTMPEERSDSDVAASESEIPPMNQLDNSCEDASEQLGDGIANIMLEKSSDLDVSTAAKDNGHTQGEQKAATAEPRGTELFQKEDKNDESITGNCDDNVDPLASSTVYIKLAQEKKSSIEQENLISNPLAYNPGSCSYDIGEKPSRDQKEPWTSQMCSGESSNNVVSNSPPFVQSMDRVNSSKRAMNAWDMEEPWLAGLCSGEIFKETEVAHCIKSMKGCNQGPASNDQFLKKRKYEGAAATTSTEPESCSKRRQQRILAVRKVPMSKAIKIFGVRC